MKRASTVQTDREIPLARPDITDLERQAVLRVLETPILSSP